MDASALIATGLTPLQASAYALLIEKGEVKPPQLVKQLSITRSNAYKLLDKLVELGLAAKAEQGKTLVYRAANPIALATLTERFRAEATVREEAVSSVMQDLLATYHTHSDKPGVTVVTGRKAVAAAYRKQIELREDVNFIRTKADIPMMGFDTMHDIRTRPAHHGKQRAALMAHQAGGKINYKSHERSNLDVTWITNDDYDAPVEWSVTKSSLLIVLYATEPHAILIIDPVVAGAFLQLWKLLQVVLAERPTHQQLKTPK